jgi:hypothetical protein
MTMISKALVVVSLMGGTILTALPAQAGASTGTWKHSPQEIYAYQRYQQRQGWQARRQPYGHAYGYHRGPARGYYGPPHGYGHRRGWSEY